MRARPGRGPRGRAAVQPDCRRRRIGFDAAAAPADGHRGLRNMADRARSLDGYLDVASTLGRGTRVELVVPLTL